MKYLTIAIFLISQLLVQNSFAAGSDGSSGGKDVSEYKQAVNLIKSAKKYLGADTFETVQDAAMGKILRGMGATTGEGGAIKLTDDFGFVTYHKHALTVFSNPCIQCEKEN